MPTEPETLSSTMEVVTQGYVVQCEAQARGSVSADVREMLVEHSMTKTDGS